MHHVGRAAAALGYGGLALQPLGVLWAFAATGHAPAVRLAPLALGDTLVVFAYLLRWWVRRRWSRPASPAVWERIGARLLVLPDLDAVCEPDPAERERLRRTRPR